MIEFLKTHPLLQIQFEAKGSPRELFPNNMVGDLSLRAVEIGGAKAVCSVTFFRLAETKFWSPEQARLVGTSGFGSVETLSDNSLVVDIQIQSVLSRSGVGRVASPSREEEDYRLPFEVPLPIHLTLRLSPVAGKLPVRGLPGEVSIVLNEASADKAIRKRGTSVLLNANARLFEPSSDWVDASGAVRRIYFLPVRIIKLEQEGVVPSGESIRGRIEGAASIWTNVCNIEIRPSIFRDPVVASPQINQELGGGGTISLEIEIKKIFTGTVGVPVVFVSPIFIPAGARATGLGRDEVVIITDQVPSNKLLLAHELGHILRGTDFPAGVIGKSWAGEEDTIMHPTGDVNREPKPVAGDNAIAKAFEEAFYEDIIL